MKRCEVDPNDLRFTQNSIAVKFKPPHDSTRIDDAVDKIRSGAWSASTFPSISVVEVDGVLFSLDNRRLWVFRKAKVSSITVKLQNKCLAHPRVQGLEDNPTLTESMKSRGFFPRVRGRNVKQHWPAAPPPIFISHRLASTPKCSPSQVPFGPIVCVHNKKERLAPPITTASMKPNACRDPKPASSRQDSKGKLAVVEEVSSQLPIKIPSAAGPTLSSGRPQSETRMDPRLATGVWKPKPDSISQGMGNPEAPPKQPKQVPKVTDASMDLLDWQPINLETIPNEELPDKRLNARILPKPVEILGISITPADCRNERFVDMPPSSEGDPLLRHVPVRNIPRIWTLLHVPFTHIVGCCGFVFTLVMKLCRRRPLPSASTSASAASNV